MGAGAEFEARQSHYDDGAKWMGKRILEFIKSKQPKDLVVACICGDVKWMIDKKELEEFLEKESFKVEHKDGADEMRAYFVGKVISIYDLGMFFWERGGEQFVKEFNGVGNAESSNDFEKLAEWIINKKRDGVLLAQSFLDCLACLGEKKVKELIKKLAGVEQ